MAADILRRIQTGELGTEGNAEQDPDEVSTLPSPSANSKPVPKAPAPSKSTPSPQFPNSDRRPSEEDAPELRPGPSQTQQPTSKPASASIHAAPTPKASVDRTVVEAATKHSKFAVSALQYDDIPTAIENLKKALAVLGVRPS